MTFMALKRHLFENNRMWYGRHTLGEQVSEGLFY
jgi:hypothetical protein